MRTFVTILACSSLLWGGTLACAQQVAGLQSREYKLMLRPERFDIKDPAKTVGEFWENLKTVIAEDIGRRDDGGPRHQGSFTDSKQRRILFRDTPDCALNEHGYTLRERIKIKKGKPEREVTLKFRTPDLIIAADARPDKAKAKFEEDIAPLVVPTTAASGAVTAAFARPPSMRSLFSVSIDNDIEPSDHLLTVGDASAIYPDLINRLRAAGAPAIDAGVALKEGATFHEVVFEGASVDLGHKVDAEFDLSLWYAADAFEKAAPSIAELSFKYSVDDGDAAVARRALTLFKALQIKLDKWASADRETKTSAALPKSCH
jgi:hypothetical protein